MKMTTLCLLVKEGKILLAMKKRGFGVGKINGIGGKVEQRETIEEAASREVEEKIGEVVDPAKVENVGNIKFYFKDRSEWNQHMHIFLVRGWEGEPRESEEMVPKWYSTNEIPFDAMWADDKHWLPVVLVGKKVEGEFNFVNEGAQIDGFNIREI